MAAHVRTEARRSVRCDEAGFKCYSFVHRLIILRKTRLYPIGDEESEPFCCSQSQIELHRSPETSKTLRSYNFGPHIESMQNIVPLWSRGLVLQATHAATYHRWGGMTHLIPLPTAPLQYPSTLRAFFAGGGASSGCCRRNVS